MSKHQVGPLIRKGSTSNEIKKEVTSFPDNPDIEYFISLGYSYNTARIYVKLLQKNNLINLYQTSSLIFSKNADVNNVLLDICALKSEEILEIIKNSNSVTILYSTIKEMEKLRIKQNIPRGLKEKIRGLTKEILLSDSKYNLVPFKFKSHEYTDEIILQYLISLSNSERPTLLTADQNFALRAKCLNLNYILYMKPDSENKTEKEVSKIEDKKDINVIKAPSGNLGVKFLVDDSIVIQKFSSLVKIFIVNNNECKDVTYTRNLDCQKFDYLAIIAKSKKHGIVKVQKVVMNNNYEKRSEILYSCKDDVKENNVNLHPIILETITELF